MPFDEVIGKLEDLEDVNLGVELVLVVDKAVKLLLVEMDIDELQLELELVLVVEKLMEVEKEVVELSVLVAGSQMLDVVELQNGHAQS